ncbi:hypothetical protein KEJ21_03945 [Candidatus Bathyarchaeota archaeon]|nr:hypothetical protein [Candidatus Bathyarchaeota archaeon]
MRQARKEGGNPREAAKLFPQSEANYRYMWNLALRKSNNGSRDPKTKIREHHVHVLRKWFRTRLAVAIPVDIVESLMGHEGYLTEVYRRYSEEDLAKFYKQGEHQLLIFTEAGEVSKLKEEVEERNKQLQQIINTLVVENTELKSRINLIVSENEELKRRTRKVEEKIEELIKTLSP